MPFNEIFLLSLQQGSDIKQSTETP